MAGGMSSLDLMNFKHQSSPAINSANAWSCITTSGVQDLANWMSNGYRIGNSASSVCNSQYSWNGISCNSDGSSIEECDINCSVIDLINSSNGGQVSINSCSISSCLGISLSGTLSCLHSFMI